MLDLNNMTGIEFEQFCKKILESYGFRVTTTATTGDGGIDLIAVTNNVFFKGKYIIQCKRYTGSVGEPIIRDLYGVVMAERANKGILITTGTFTNAAISFANDKQLELIDGNTLHQLINKGEYDNSSKKVKKSIFDSDRFNYYIEQFESINTDYSVYYNFLKFISSYIIDSTIEKNQSEIFDAFLGNEEKANIISILSDLNKSNYLQCVDTDIIQKQIIPNIDLAMNKLVTNRACKTKIGESFYQLLVFKYYGLKQLLQMNFSEYIVARLNYLNSSMYADAGFNYSTYLRWNVNDCKRLNSCEIQNIITILTFLNDEDDIKVIRESEVFSKFNKRKNIDFEHILQSKQAIIIYPDITYYKNNKSAFISAPYYHRINMTEYFEKHLTETIKNEQIQKIKMAVNEICR